MIQITGLLEKPQPQRDFVEDYLGMIKTFRSHVYAYEFCTNKNPTPIKNTDLWIESFIFLVPELIEFREYVLSEMNRLNIFRYQPEIYQQNNNHYVYSNIRQIEELRKSLS